jgi:hypothetical protein
MTTGQKVVAYATENNYHIFREPIFFFFFFKKQMSYIVVYCYFKPVVV